MMKLKKEDIIGLILILAFSVISIYDLKVLSPEMPFKYRIVFYCFIGIVDVLTIILYLYLKNRPKIPIEKRFLYIAFVIGIFYLVGIPTMKGTDEPHHLFRIYQISQNNIIVDNFEKDYNMIPENLFSYAWGWGASAYKPEKIFEKMSPNMIKLDNGHVAYKYAPTQYIPQLIGFNIAKLFQLGPVLTGLLTRLSNFLIWLAISYYALKRIPVHKCLVCLLYAAPAMLSLVSTMSGDAFLNCCSLYYIAMILDLYIHKSNVSNKDLIFIIVLAIIISSIKIVYIPIILFVFILKKKQFEDKKKHLFLILGIITAILLSLIWNKISAPLGNDGSSILATQQLNFILKNPIEYCLITFRTFTNNIVYYITNLFAGNEMCYAIVQINNFLVIAYFVLALCSLKTNENQINLSKFQKLLIWGGFLLIFCATTTAMYMYFTTITEGVGYSSVRGVQSRYFVTLIPILILTIPISFNKKFDINKIINFSVIINAMILIQTIGSLIAACYNG